MSVRESRTFGVHFSSFCFDWWPAAMRRQSMFTAWATSWSWLVSPMRRTFSGATSSTVRSFFAFSTLLAA